MNNERELLEAYKRENEFLRRQNGNIPPFAVPKNFKPKKRVSKSKKSVISIKLQLYALLVVLFFLCSIIIYDEFSKVWEEKESQPKATKVNRGLGKGQTMKI
jgi:hypothetical protein